MLKGSSNVADYGAIAQYGFDRNYGVNSSGEGLRVGLIVARKAANIAIIGRGAIDGNGDSFFDLKSSHNGADLCFRCPYQAKVMKVLETNSRRIVVISPAG